MKTAYVSGCDPTIGKGLPGSAGRAEGYVRVLNLPEESS